MGINFSPVCAITLKFALESFQFINSVINQSESYLVMLCKAMCLIDEELCFTFRLQLICAAPRFLPVIRQWSLTLSLILSASTKMGSHKTDFLQIV